MSHAYVSGGWGPLEDRAKAICREHNPVWTGDEHHLRELAARDAHQHDHDRHPVEGDVLFLTPDEI